MSLTEKILAVPYTKEFLTYSWSWLQDEEMRNLTMTPIFSKDDQITWFNRLGDRDDYLIWGIQFEGKPVGAFGIKNIQAGAGEYWGYIGDKNYWGIGIGKWMIGKAIEYANDNNFQHLYLKVHPQNIRAIQLYLKSDFVILDSQDNTSNLIWMEYHERD